MKSSLFTVLIVLIQISTIELNAQNFSSVAGQVTDSNNQGLDIALVSILNPVDSNMIKSEYSDVDGSFEISKIKPGKYLISITHLGFEPLFVKDVEVLGNNEIKDLGALKMQVLANTLKEVNVTAKVPYIERKIDRTIVNVESLIANDGSNALEALERAPGISTDNNGNLKLKGRGGVQVYVDDKPTYMAGNELEVFLKNLPANSVKQIEIMTNPPAKYEAAGNSGIINIVLKRNRTKGLNGTVSTGLTQGRYTRSNNSINLNYNTNKTSIYGNLSGGIQNSFQDLNINRFYKNADLSPLSSFSQNSFIEKQNRSINGKIGVDWFISDHTTIGTSIKSMTAPGEEFTDNKAVILNQLNQLQNRVNADNRQDKSFDNQTYKCLLEKIVGFQGSQHRT